MAIESKYDKKLGIDGIATLTNDPIAVENIRKGIEEQKKLIDYAEQEMAKTVGFPKDRLK
jgi:hypothetical protein